jgi:mannosyltransferase OCH1-like enzyme
MDVLNQHVDILPDDFVFTKAEPVIPAKLHLVWVGNNPQPDYVQPYLAKWKELMPDWEVKLWTNEDILELPAEYVAKINAADKGVQRADLAKWFIIEQKGGIYIDCDVEPHRSLEPIRQLGKQVVLCHDLWLSWAFIGAAFFSAVPNHPLFKTAAQLCLQAELNTEDIHMKTGPRILGEAVYLTKPDEKYVLLPHQYFYRNKAGELTYRLENTDHIFHREKDFDERFGHHFYAKLWN